MFDTPILFIIFNRVDVTLQVFNAIRQQKPKFLYVAADGPRKNKPGEAELCQQTRDVIKLIDWDCELKTLFQDENLGCGKGESTAMTWFFEHVEQGIILEDDCLPHPDFFTYCQEMLEKYKDNDQIMVISGNNFQGGIKRGDASFYFSAFNHHWGWASWRTRWEKYIFDISNIPLKQVENAMFFYFNDRSILRHWIRIFKLMRKSRIDTWDYQFTFVIWLNRGLSVIPNKNLVSNIGFGENAIHTFKEIEGLSNVPTYPILPLKYPDTIEQNKEADLYYSYKFKCRRSIFKILKTHARETVYFFMRLLKLR
ncbi:MAG: nucleotide-diphospho-sugar transferase [Dysgonamonadaceae bacterium]|jgi:hypothetical protein|nr:nucleotide-diphospho-sugar transferase [Dysgonamonadaceae bacterium]